MSEAAEVATKRVKLWLDSDIIEWFRAKQGSTRGYQKRINAALRQAVEKQREAG